MRASSAYRRVLWQLLAATRGGPTRVRILKQIRDQPRNTNQLAVALGLDYKTVEHHIRVLRKNRIVVPHADGYGALYALTLDMEIHLDEFERIADETQVRGRATEGAA